MRRQKAKFENSVFSEVRMTGKKRNLGFRSVSALTLLIVFAAFMQKIDAQSAKNNFEWPTYGADLASTRYRPLDQIDASNFNKLQVAWTFKADNLGPRQIGRAHV